MKNEKMFLESIIPIKSKKIFGLNSKYEKKIQKIFEADGQPPLEDNPRFDDIQDDYDEFIDQAMDCMQDIYGVISQLNDIKEKWTPAHFEEVLIHIENDNEIGNDERMMIVILKQILGK